MLAAHQEFGTREMDVQGLMDAVAERATRILRAGGAAIDVAEGPHLVCRAATGMAEPLKGQRVALGQSPTWHGVRAGDVLRVDAPDAPDADAARMRRTAARSTVTVPLRRDLEVVGALSVFAPDHHAFDDVDTLSLQFMATVVVTAMERWRQYKARHELLDERTVAQRRRKEAEARADILFHKNPTPLVLLGDHLEILDANERFSRVVGLPREDLAYRHLPQMLHHEDAPRVTADEGGGQSFHVRLTRAHAAATPGRPDAPPMHARLRLVPLPARPGFPPQTLGLFEDLDAAADPPPGPAPSTSARAAAPALAAWGRLDVGHAMQASLRAFQSYAARNAVHVETRVQPNLFVRGDAALLEYALRSLVENVVRTAAGHSHLLVQAGVAQGAVVVQFSGTALQPGRIERLLPDARAPGMAHVGRDGLGLEEAHRILSMHGGRLWWRASGANAVLGISLMAA